MSLRVKPAKTQIVSHLRMMRKYAAEKLCKKVAFSLRKPTALFRKMGTRIFFLEQPLVIRKIRVPLCSKVRNVFVEQSEKGENPNISTLNPPPSNESFLQIKNELFITYLLIN